MGRKALKHSAVPPKFPAEAGLFVLTNISLSGNVEITVWTTFALAHCVGPCISLKRLKRELQLISVEYSFQHGYGGYTSLAASVSLLSSVTAFIRLL